MMDEIQCRITMIGDVGVGKTSITNMFAIGTFDEKQESTNGASFRAKTILAQNSLFKFLIWDTSVYQKYEPLLHFYLKNQQVVILIFDLTDMNTFSRLNVWLQYLRDLNEQFAIILVGNKSDLSDIKQIGYDQIKSYADSQKCEFRIVSAKTNEGIQELFQLAGSKIRNQYPQSQISKTDQKNFGCW